MIKEKMLFMAAHAYLNAYADFANAYGKYHTELTHAKRKIVVTNADSVSDEREVSKTLTKKVNFAAAKLFELNGLCKRAYGQGFIISDHPIIKDLEKEDMINEAFDCLTTDHADSVKRATV